MIRSMAQTSLRERPGGHRAPRTLVLLANITALYPVFALVTLHGQWCLAWWVLGHQPRPSLDDPKYIDGASWMHDITAVALLGYVPMALVTAVLNTAFFCAHSHPGLRLSLRVVGIVGLWIAVPLILRSDHGLVVSWWLD